MGHALGWRIVDWPATGDISNVSAFVLPAGTPVADDRQQLPMFPDPERILRLLEDMAETQRETAHVQRLLAEQQLHYTAPHGAAAEDDHRYQPRDEEFRTWSGFRTEMQRLEARVRRERRLAASDQVSKKDMGVAGGPSGKTIERILERAYALPAKLWPPSTWPEELPQQETNGQI